MTYLKRPLLTVISITLLPAFLVVAYARQQAVASIAPSLGVEIALSKAFYIPAAVEGRITSAVIRVPYTESLASGTDPLSAVRIVPRMKGEKVAVAVYALFGDASQVQSCQDWKSFRATLVASYEAELGDTISISKLGELGARFGEKPLSFSIVPKKKFSLTPSPLDGFISVAGGGCGCASCEGLQCCPNPGKCLGCGDCGQACCEGSGGN